MCSVCTRMIVDGKPYNDRMINHINGVHKVSDALSWLVGHTRRTRMHSSSQSCAQTSQTINSQAHSSSHMAQLCPILALYVNENERERERERKIHSIFSSQRCAAECCAVKHARSIFVCVSVCLCVCCGMVCLLCEWVSVQSSCLLCWRATIRAVDYVRLVGKEWI